MSGAPKSSAPLIIAALISDAEGEAIFTCSRINSLVNAASPPATDADWEVPETDMYNGSPSV